uniref:Uncharacterized protein n=1 Tax=Graphocephala atropunctata TaxID=36148 RepID=A0A1B6LHN8_9HEMI
MVVRVCQGQQLQQETLDLLDLRGLQGQTGPWDPRESQENLATLGQWVPPDFLAVKAQQGVKEYPGHQERKESLDQEGQKEFKVLQEEQALKDLRVLREEKETLESLENRVQWDLGVFQESWDHLDYPERQGT